MLGLVACRETAEDAQTDRSSNGGCSRHRHVGRIQMNVLAQGIAFHQYCYQSECEPFYDRDFQAEAKIVDLRGEHFGVVQQRERALRKAPKAMSQSRTGLVRRERLNGQSIAIKRIQWNIDAVEPPEICAAILQMVDDL
jgi:hypothetical protein